MTHKDVDDLYIRILKEELVPAMGCTEPIAIAYAAAKARAVLGEMPKRVELCVSGNIVKNVKSVVVPNTGGLEGMEAAVAAGVVAGDDERVLEVIASVSDAKKKHIRVFLEQTEILIRPLSGDELLDIIVHLYSDAHSSLVRIADTHTNIVRIEKDGEVLFESGSESAKAMHLTDRSLLNIEDIVAFADSTDLQNVKPLIDAQIACNTAIANEGLTNDYGANIGKVLQQTRGTDIRTKAKALAAAGSDARMSGSEMPVIINSGSGNQGLALSLPVIAYAREFGVSEDKLIRALLVANLTTIHLKTGIGRLSAYCGAVSAGCGAGAGIAYLLGGDLDEIIHTLVNSLAIVSGIVCDGAKPSCAAKIATAVDAGIFGYEMYKQGQQFFDGEGLVSKGVENTIANIGRLGREGMRETDKEIIRIMTGICN
jgi:L-cysteine desulfidase